MDFCGAVGCEPMICINAGSGTPEEAARWVQYCNGSADSPHGPAPRRRRPLGPVQRAALGDRQRALGPLAIRWTTAAGYLDRYQRFRKAMLAADPTIRLYACGAPIWTGRNGTRR